MAIHFVTRDFEFSHGRMPRGRGGWAFSAVRNPLGSDIFWASGTYSEAKKAAKKHFAEQAFGLGDLDVWVLP